MRFKHSLQDLYHSTKIEKDKIKLKKKQLPNAFYDKITRRRTLKLKKFEAMFRDVISFWPQIKKIDEEIPMAV